jgi:hypothetical protein
LQYSIWEHTGTHSSHPHPPAGRRPPRTVPAIPFSQPPAGLAGTSLQRSPKGKGKSKLKKSIKEVVPPRPYTEPAVAASMSQPSQPSAELAVRPSASSQPSAEPTVTSFMSQPPAELTTQLSASLQPSARLGEVDCEGCGESSGGFMETMQCGQCKKWSHTECMQSPIELAFLDEDHTWSCPSCRGIVVWADTM